VYEESSGEALQKFGRFLLRETGTDRCLWNPFRGLGVELVTLGKLPVVCHASRGSLQARMNKRCRRLDHNGGMTVNSVHEPVQIHRMDLMADINSGKAWSPMDLADLKNSIAQGYGIEEVAQFLCRHVQEVLGKMAELEIKKNTPETVGVARVG
jgi:hypothetical protein